MYDINTGILNPSSPYLLQRLECAYESKELVGFDKDDFEAKIKCIHGGIPAKYESKAVNNIEAFMAQRKRIFSYDYMGSAEFEFGSVPRANWIFARYADKQDVRIQHVKYSAAGSAILESFWVFAPTPVAGVANNTLDFIAHHTAQSGNCYGFKEHLHIPDGMFTDKPMQHRATSLVEHTCGYFDIKNCCYVFWKHRHIAEAFARMWGLGSVFDIQAEERDANALNVPKHERDIKY